MCSNNHSEKVEGHSHERAEVVVSIHTRGVVYSMLRCITTLSPSLTQAACRAVEDAIAQGLKSVEVHTNSQFVIDGTRGGEEDGRQNCNPELLSLPAAMTTLVEKWKTNGWKTRRKVPVANREDLERLELLSQRVAVKWVSGCNISAYCKSRKSCSIQLCSLYPDPFQKQIM